MSRKIDLTTLWSVLAGQPSLDELSKRLEALPEAQLRDAAVGFVEARAEMVEALNSRRTSASEDVIDDLAGHLVRQGDAAFTAHLAGLGALPPREEWGRLERTSPVGVFTRVVESRLGEDIYDLWEAVAYG